MTWGEEKRVDTTRKRLEFLRGDGAEKANDPRKDAVKAYRSAAKTADAAGAKALGSRAPDDHAAAAAAARSAAGAAERAYHAGRGPRASNEELHDAKGKYASDADLHTRAAAGDRGAVGHLHAAAAVNARYAKVPNRVAEGQHAAAAVNAHLDAADKHKADADKHEADVRALAGAAPFSNEANQALRARNAARESTAKEGEFRRAAERVAQDHAAALSGRQRDEHGRFT